MNISNILLIAVTIIAAALFLNRKEKRELEGDESVDFQIEKDMLPDLNEKFLENVKGREVIDLVKIFNPPDKAILRSILDAEGIESYVKSNNFGDLYPTYDIHNFATSVISIYKDNAERAKEVVQDYILTLQKESYASDDSALESTVKTGSLLAGIPPELNKFVPELLI